VLCQERYRSLIPPLKLHLYSSRAAHIAQEASRNTSESASTISLLAAPEEQHVVLAFYLLVVCRLSSQTYPGCRQQLKQSSHGCCTENLIVANFHKLV
jgi:hypothetical protein